VIENSDLKGGGCILDHGMGDSVHARGRAFKGVEGR